MSTPPVIRSHHEYVDEYLTKAIGIVRQLQHLSRKHAFYEKLDKQMSHCWNTSINARTPSEDDRRACDKVIGSLTVDDLRPPILPAIREMLPIAQHCQQYFTDLPLPPGSTPLTPVACLVALCRCENEPGARFCRRCGAKLPQSPQPANAGWALPAQMVHDDAIVRDLSACIADCRCLKGLAPNDPFFESIWDQIQIMAKFTRESIHPTAEQRSEVKLDRLTVEDFDPHVEAMLGGAVERLHQFAHLYVNFPKNLYGI